MIEKEKLCPFRQETYKGNKAKSIDLIQEVRFGVCLEDRCAIYNKSSACCGFLRDNNGPRR